MIDQSLGENIGIFNGQVRPRTKYRIHGMSRITQ